MPELWMIGLWDISCYDELDSHNNAFHSDSFTYD